MDQRAGRGEATRQHILNTAIKLFAEQGYDQVSIEVVLRETGVSRGSLYYHFSGKEVLFTAALEATEARIAATVVSAANGIADPLEALRVGCNAWLDLAATDQAVRQIALIDAPSVVGWEKWREMDARYALGLIIRGLQAISATGRFPSENVDVFAHMLLAVLSEMALVVARTQEGDRSAATRKVLEEVLDRLFGATR